MRCSVLKIDAVSSGSKAINIQFISFMLANVKSTILFCRHIKSLSFSPRLERGVWIHDYGSDGSVRG